MTQPPPIVAQSWLETSEAVLRGLNHEFSNRLSLARLTPQLAALLASGEPGMEKLAADADRSEDLLHLLRLYRLMVFASDEQAEPLLVSDVVADAADLFRHHTTFRDLEVQIKSASNVPPVLMGPTSLTQALLLLFCAAARQRAVTRAETGTLFVEFTASTDAVRIAVHADRGGAPHRDDNPPEFPALRHLIRNVNGAAEVTHDGATMSVGTLVTLREREKQG